jgi:hypothetical protein
MNSEVAMPEQWFKESAAPDAALAQAKLDATVRSMVPFAQYEYVDVTFNAVADADTDIRHSLRPLTPEGIDFQVVGINFASAPAAAPVIYRDTAAARRPWGTGYIVLRANVAALSATLLLTVRPRRSQP